MSSVQHDGQVSPRKPVNMVSEFKSNLLLFMTLEYVLVREVLCLRFREKVMAISSERFQMPCFQTATGALPGGGLAIR